MKILGLSEAIGHADFYVNGGDFQPGCNDIFCSHQRAQEFFLESIRSKTCFFKLSESQIVIPVSS